MARIINAVIGPGEQSGYVADCMEVAVVTQGQTLDEVALNLQEAVALALGGESLTDLGFDGHPVISVTLELEPAVA